MVALTVLKFVEKKPKPVCHGGLYLAKAWERYRFNDEVSAACYLREAICRFLLAWCERDGVKVTELQKRSAMKVYKVYCKSQREKPCELMVDLIDQINRVVHLSPTTCEFYSLLDITQAIFEDEIEDTTNDRKGGSL